MRRLIRITSISFLLLGALQLSRTDAAPSDAQHSSGGVQRPGVSLLTDDVGACADAPSPDMHGNNPGIGGKPISLFVGAENYVHTDLTIGSLFPISVSRRYDSRTAYDSPVGFGWAINYDRRIYTYPDGSVTLRKECGWKRRFTVAGGNYITPIGETGTLVQNADGSLTYAYKSGEKDYYDTRGRLISRIDTNGNSLALYYELDSRSPLWGILPANISQTTPLIVAYDYRLSRIEEKDAAGNLTNHYVLFHYDSSTGRLTDIVDSAGRTVAYTHDGIGNLKSAAGPSTNSIYDYTDSNNKHLLTSIDEGNGAYVNAYDSSGPGDPPDPRQRHHHLRLRHPIQEDRNDDSDRRRPERPPDPDPDRGIRHPRSASQGHRHLRECYDLHKGRQCLDTCGRS